jgi:hypothetical protein
MPERGKHGDYEIRNQAARLGVHREQLEPGHLAGRDPQAVWPRRQGGRRRQVSRDVGRALVQLGKMADTWYRWVKVRP